MDAGLKRADDAHVPEQLPLDFSSSSAQRQRRALRRLERASRALDRPTLFDDPVNLDVHLLDASTAVADFPSGNPDRARIWLERLVGPVILVRSRRASFPASALPLLAWVRPPVQVTLDAASMAVARSLWAGRLRLRPLRVQRHGHRLFASSPASWPAPMRIADAPWTSILSLLALGVTLDVDPRARSLMLDRLGTSGVPLAHAGLAGSAVSLTTSHPELLESMGLPGLSYSGPRGSGSYRLPLLCAEPLLRASQVLLSSDVAAAIQAASRRPRPLASLDGFPWTLYEFQSRDVARALRILEVTGGVLLAAEMGAGKTTMALALAQRLELWPLLVVAPLSAFSTWQRQLSEMGKSFLLATGPPSQVWDALAQGGFDAVVLSYDRLSSFAEAVEAAGFRGLVADEVQRIRTPGSRRSRALRHLAASVPYRIGLSGTPLTNAIGDLLPLGAFLVPGEWRPRASSKDLSDMYPGDPVEALAEHLGSMMVRRRMTEVGARLPRRNTHRLTVELEPEQRRALLDLQAEAEQAARDGAFDDPASGRMHAFSRLSRMRQAVNSPSALGLRCPNPKVRAAVDLAGDFLARGRKGVIFCADRTAFSDIGRALDADGVGWVGIWGDSSAQARIDAEARFHSDPDVGVVVCTVQAGSESWSASPTATWLICTSYVYSPAMLAQMEARVYRMNSDPDGPDIEVCYVHANVPGGGLDDRMVEILEVKRHLFAQVVDRADHVDDTKVHLSMTDLLFLLTGQRDGSRALREADARATVGREEQARQHARATAHRHKGRNRQDGSLVVDDGSSAVTLDEWRQVTSGDR